MNVTCVIQVMKDTRADTYFDALINEHRYSAVWKHLRESHNLDRPNMHEKMQRQLGMSDL